MVIGGPGMDPKANLFVRDEEEDKNNHPILTASQLSNFRDGFESQLQIQIGPHGGTISASRRRNSGHLPSSNNPSNVNCPSHNKFPVSNLSNSDYINSMQQMNEDLVAAQRERKQKLETSLSSERIRLSILRGEIASLRSKFQKIPDLERLKNKNQHLRLECDLMTRQVDLYDNGTVPLGETSEEFYREINPGQDAKSLISSTSAEANLGTTNAGRWPRGSGRGKPPPRPPPPRILHFNPHPPQNQTHHHHSTINPNNNENDNQSGEWCCFMCTFRNHPDLEQCEQCQMVRVRPSRREQNIRIRVIRRPNPNNNSQSQQKQEHQPRRIVHSSWLG